MTRELEDLHDAAIRFEASVQPMEPMLGTAVALRGVAKALLACVNAQAVSETNGERTKEDT